MKMKLLMLAFAVIAMSSCEELSDLTKIEMPFNKQITIPASTSGIEVKVETPDIKTNLDSVFKKYDITGDFIQSISLNNMDLELKVPENSDLGFIKDIEVSISATGLSDVIIAKANDVAASPGKKLVLQTQNVALKDFLFKEQFKLKFKITTQNALTEEHKVDLKYKFILDLKVMGL